MPEPKVHAAVRSYDGEGWEALCRHIAWPRLTDDRREVTCEACRTKLARRSRRRLWRRHRV